MGPPYWRDGANRHSQSLVDIKPWSLTVRPWKWDIPKGKGWSCNINFSGMSCSFWGGCLKAKVSPGNQIQDLALDPLKSIVQVPSAKLVQLCKSGCQKTTTTRPPRSFWSILWSQRVSVGHRFRTSVLVRRLSTTRRQSSGARTERPGRRPRCLAPALTQTFQAKLVQIVRVEPVGLWFVQPCNSTARTAARCDQSFSSAMMSCKTVIASGMLIDRMATTTAQLAQMATWKDWTHLQPIRPRRGVGHSPMSQPAATQTNLRKQLAWVPGLGFKNLQEWTCRLSGQAWDGAARHSQGTSNTWTRAFDSPHSHRQDLVPTSLNPRSSWVVHRTTWVVHRSSCGVHRTTWVVHRSSWVVNRITWVAHRSSWVVHRTTWVAHRSSWVDVHSEAVCWKMRAHSQPLQHSNVGISSTSSGRRPCEKRRSPFPFPRPQLTS